MGCCLSTKRAPKSNPDLHFSKSASNGGRCSLPPPRPPPPPEEETVVKEVLSETPIPKPPTSIQIQPNKIKITIKQSEIEEEKEVRVESTAVIEPIRPNDEIASEISEVSEMYSFSESFSTNTVAERRDDDGEVTQILKSPAKPLRKRPEIGAHSHRSPARRTAAPSPERRRGQISSGAVQGRTTTQRRNVGPPNKIRRDSGEGSGRRSRSPATRGEAAASSRAVRHESPVGTTGGRMPAETSENDGKLGKVNDGVSPETGEIESLENPLVSFECFIFL